MGILDIARIHMLVMGFLASGLLVSISMFQKAWNDVQGSRGSASGPVGVDKDADKTDWCLSKTIVEKEELLERGKSLFGIKMNEKRDRKCIIKNWSIYT